MQLMDTKRFFDSNISFGKNEEIEKLLKKIIKTTDKTKLLDAGCGIGKYFNLFKGKLYGIDYSKNRVEEARKVNKKVNFKVGDISALPYKSSFFDFVISIDAVQHIESKRKRKEAIKEFNRVLKKRGLLFFVFDNKYYPRTADLKGWKYFIYKYSFHEIIPLLEGSGFQVKKIYGIGKIPLKIFSKKGVIVAEKV